MNTDLIKKSAKISLLILLITLLTRTAEAQEPLPPSEEIITTSVGLTVNVAAGRKPISPYIYGLNYAKEAFANEIDLPVRRWGGNHTSRYNWQGNFMNHGSDWFFHNNINYDPYPGGGNQTADQWIDQNESIGADSLLTVPIIGYVAKDGNQASCGFKVSLYGGQDDTDNESGFPNCGNGLSGGVPVVNNPSDTSTAVTQLFATTWLNHLKATHGAANAGGVKFYALDNEPELWNQTHRDVHPNALRYDELWTRSRNYAAAIKCADPAAQIFGYASFGWTGYWYSQYDVEQAAANGYTYFPDYATHGNKYQAEWYLQQMAQYQQINKVRLLDYLDLHFYPQNGVDLSYAGDAAKQALRLRSTRALWDPSYVDESWIAQAGPDGGIVRLIPRMHDWVNTNYPGTKLALTEYNWGGLESINGALVQADILGIFGREGLDLATLWNYPDPALGYHNFEAQPGAYAFRLYRNYDGIGSKFGDVSVSATSADQSQLAVYAAQRLSDNTLTLMIINKTGGALTGNVSLAGFTPTGAAQVYRYSAANLNAIVRQADQPVSAAGFNASFPANSITLAVVPGGVLSFGTALYLPITMKHGDSPAPPCS